jgi:hypothetical protein
MNRSSSFLRLFIAVCVAMVLFVGATFAQQPLTMTVTIATMEGVTGSSIRLQESPKTSIGGTSKSGTSVSGTSAGVQISPLYARTEAAAARAAFEMIPKEQHLERAQALFTLLRLTEYETITKQFDTTLLKATPVQLAKQWMKTVDKLGDFRSIRNTTSEQFATGELVTVEADFDRVLLDVKFSFTEQHLLNGVAFAPTGPKYQTPKYVRLDSIEERSITVNADKYTLPGILTLPKFIPQGVKIPVAILLHGAGAEDKDRTSGPVKPNKDLALGLAMQGIASIRYEKRIKLYALKGKESETFTVNDEVIDDAVAALQLARTLAGEMPIDASKIVVIAPNLAATLVPRIYEKDKQKNAFAPRFVGAVMVAANHQKWLETVRSRFTKAFQLDGNITSEERRVLSTLEKEITLVNSNELSPKTSTEKLPFNLPGSYWMDIRKYDHVQAITNAPFAMLFLHGEKDRYMGFEEFTAWKERAGKKQNTTFKSYPDLVNLLLPKPPENEVSEKPSNIPSEVIMDITTWIRSVK